MARSASCRVHEDVARVEEPVARADEFREDIDDEGGDLQCARRVARFARIKGLPAGDAEALPGAQAGGDEDVAAAWGLAARLPQQAEGLIEHALELDR